LIFDAAHPIHVRTAHQQQTFLSCGKTIPVEVFTPAAAGRHAALVVLHGSGGYRDFSKLAQNIASHGYAVLAPQYFESTGTAWASGSEIAQHALTWAAVVQDAVSFAAQQSFVDPDRIALIGFSLGAYLAIGVAAQNERIKAVVEFFGGLPGPLAAFIQRLPPTLILHGEADAVVPLREGRRLEQLCRARNICVETETYPGVGHHFPPAIMERAMQRALSFLDQHLSPVQQKTKQPA
jgi:carboxymethylenebutenolidase